MSILVEELISRLTAFPPKARVLIGDNEEGVVRDISNICLITDYYRDLAKNGLPVVEIEIKRLRD